MLLVAAVCFSWILWKRATRLMSAAPDPRMDRMGERFSRLFRIGVGQSRQPRYPVAGILHIVIFFGFLILTVRSLTLLGLGFFSDFTLPGLGGVGGDVYAALKDWTALFVLLACCAAAWRRLVVKPARYHDRHATQSHGSEAYVILGLISVLLLADALFEGSELAREGHRTLALPMASLAASLLGTASEGTLDSLGLGAFWVHNLALCFFACFLPISKHFHVITALPNVFFGKLPSAGRVKPPRHGALADTETEDESEERIGVSRLEDFTWKHLLDFYSCTDCGRCTDNCPAYKSGTPLSPRMISIKARDEAYAAWPILGTPPDPESRPTLVGDLIKDEELWACTTCRACEDACPVTIEYVDKIVDMRRYLVDEGRVPSTLQKALSKIEKRGNPYGKPSKKRADWIGDEDNMRLLDDGDAAELCFFTDSGVAFDPRLQEIGQAFAGLLAHAKVDCGTLGRDEVDSGHEARRIGEEGLFEMLCEQNTEALQQRKIGRIVTTDPHAYNSLVNDYKLDTPVVHHSELLDELVKSGKLPLEKLNGDHTYTFHDPCYLGRHNDIYDAPRRVLDAIPGMKRVEMQASRNKSSCCGGGSLYLFNEGECEMRMGEQRLDQVEQAGADVVVTACPFCMINFEDAIKTTGREGKMQVVDLAELLSRCLPENQETPLPPSTEERPTP